MVDLEATIRSSLDDRYVIESELGAGAMAVVFLAHDLKHDRSVAIKVLKPELASAIGGDRFQREIEVVAGLTHPHILPLYDSGEAAGLLYFVMPYIEGESLRGRLKREGRLPVRDAIRITREIADALGFAHRHGIIHRDVKPGNILLTEHHARLADFGIAHLAETEGGTLTGTGLALGTPAYFSPEQATGDRDLDGRSDVYSLGCVLYEALTGQPPFTATSVRALITHHIVDAPPQVKELRPEVSEGIEAVVQTALRKEPEKRFQTAEEMAGSLDLISGGFEAIAAAALRKLIGPRHKWLHGKRLAVLVAAAVMVLAAGVFTVWSVVRGPGFSRTVATYMLVPSSGGGATVREVEIAERAVRTLYFQLSDWQSIRVVGPDALQGPIADLQLAGMVLPSLNLVAIQRIAGQVGASHVVRVQALALGDSVALVATISSRDSPDEEERAIRKDGREEELEFVTAGLALGILGLHGESADYDDLLKRSPNHDAHQQFRDGQIALYDWRLSEAEEHFREAIEQDSAFALAHHYLAQTLYWRTARDPERLLDLGPEIERHSRRALQYDVEGRLRPGERNHVQAFHSFWTGDFDEARTRYDRILSSNPTDLEGLILRGSVEFEDPWLTDGPDGSLTPRLDLDLARAMYDSAANLNSQWQLAWGRLYDIDRTLASAAYKVGCDGFHPPEYPERLTPYSTGEAAVVSMFCPIFENGSIVWIPDSLDAAQLTRARAGVRQMHQATVESLEHWAQVERDQPRHHEELADWLLWERSIPGCAADPAESDSLAALARSHLERALVQRQDSTPEDRIRLAALGMTTGDYEEARRAMDAALAALGDWRSTDGPTPPAVAANPYMALGEIHPAVDILESVYGSNTTAVDDPSNPDDTIDMGETFGTLYALSALGYMGQSGPEVQSRFEALARAWTDGVYTDRQQAVLRWASLHIIGPALVHSPDRWEGWIGDLEEQELELPAVWRGLMLAETRPDEALDLLDQAVADLERERQAKTLRAKDFYLPLILAERTGSDSLAADLRERASECSLHLDREDFGWGMTKYLAGEMVD